MKTNNLDLSRLISVINRLRSATGCPWDKQQTLHSFSHYLQQECEELMTAIEKNDNENICEELGDVLFILFSLIAIAEEKKIFTGNEVLNGIADKMIFRHPHVFGDLKIDNVDELQTLWKQMKEKEKKLT